MKLASVLTLPTLALSLLAFSQFSPQSHAQEGGGELDVNELLKAGKQFLNDNPEVIQDALGQLDNMPVELDQITNLMVDAKVPRAAYLRLTTKPISEETLKSLQGSAKRAEEKGSGWAKHAILSAIRYQDKLRGDTKGGHGAFDLLCEFDSAKSPTKATVILIEDEIIDENIRGKRWDIILERNLDSGVWMPVAAATASLPR